MTQKLWTVASGFFGKMVAKLIKQRTVYGYTGWDGAISIIKLQDSLQRNIRQRDWVDVANLAMMLDYRDQQIKAQQEDV